MALPPTPAALKSISPYLQRADELRAKEPVIAYWCTYYAAQVGIALKAKDTASRSYLFELLGALERMKAAIGPTDAIDIEAASAAYVENFALRVFGVADNEDRSGSGNRSTAKKFLAAANFLEVLKTFPKAEVSETNEEKIRYAKWKAADIAKAYREGRKATPGPAGSDPAIDAELLELQQAPSLTTTNSTTSSITVQGSPPSHSHIASARASSSSPPKTKRSSPHMEPTDIANANRDFLPQTPPRHNKKLDVNIGLQPGNWAGEHSGEATPGSWSTAATPGTGSTPQEPINGPQSPTFQKGKGKERSGSGSSSGSGRGGLLFKPVDGGNTNFAMSSDTNESGKKSVHFTPSVVGGLSSTAGSLPASPTYQSGAGHPAMTNASWQGQNGSAPYSGLDLPPGFVPDLQHPAGEASQPPYGGLYASAPPLPPAPGGIYRPIVPPPPPPPASVHPPPPSVPEVELTPTIIAKAQKHCRFAISALDYEDAEQARRELRAALLVLGG
ncbi:Vta1 like-domain-containing protein [Mycena belliarum]|uniref:Vta1 like-domain-containing protein n=1 Tax=Mycena belliarum TaxID=1033014 RepID=A0AAD6UKI8_9AGAR|nr:Vta1 like-domain-containing protein [Mycena belliae]